MWISYLFYQIYFEFFQTLQKNWKNETFTFLWSCLCRTQCWHPIMHEANGHQWRFSYGPCHGRCRLSRKKRCWNKNRPMRARLFKSKLNYGFVRRPQYKIHFRQWRNAKQSKKIIQSAMNSDLNSIGGIASKLLTLVSLLPSDNCWLAQCLEQSFQ